jgi:hypothetical protein
MHKAFDQVEQHEEYTIVALLIYPSIHPEKPNFSNGNFCFFILLEVFPIPVLHFQHTSSIVYLIFQSLDQVHEK